MRFTIRFQWLFYAALSIMMCSSARAQHAGDIFLQVVDDRIETGTVNVNQTITSPVLVFAGEFGDSGVDEFTQNPGFDSLPGTFQTGTRLGWNALSGLTVWNGDGFEPTGGESLLVTFSSLNFTVADEAVDGFDLAVQPDGGFHRHLNFVLQGAGTEEPEPGVYLLHLEMYSTDPSVADSQPFWIVFDYQAAGQHDQAIEWVEDNLAGAPACPEDTNDDGVVDVTDLLNVLAAWGACVACPEDSSGDGQVNVTDLLNVLAAWGDCPA